MKRLLSFSHLALILFSMCCALGWILAPTVNAQDDPTEIRFIVGHADCSGVASFEFSINGTPVGTGAYPSTNGCVCNITPLIVSLNDAETLNLIGPVGCTLIHVDVNSARIGYIRVEIDRTESGTESYCLWDPTGGGCADRDLCDGYAEWLSIAFENKNKQEP